MKKEYCFRHYGTQICGTNEFLPVLAGHIEPHQPSVNIHKTIKTINRDINDIVRQQRTKAKREPHHIHDTIDNYLKKNVDDKHHEDIKKVLHPIFLDNTTKPTLQTIPDAVREQAIMADASLRYNNAPPEMREQVVETYLAQQGLGEKFTIDYNLSNPNGLVFIDENGKANIALRGTQILNKNDWVNNAKLLFDTKGDTPYLREIEELYRQAEDAYGSINKIIGYSRGGNGAIHLGNKFGVDTITFNPAVNIANARTNNPNITHEIYSTTEDFASIFAPLLSAGNKNVKYNSIDPLLEYDSLNPYLTHSINNIIKSGDRRVGHGHYLTNKSVNLSKQIGELDYALLAKQAIDRGESFTDYLKIVNPADVNPVDNTLSKRIKANAIEHRSWIEQNGSLTRGEQQHLTFNEPNTTPLSTTSTQRIDYANAPERIRRKNIMSLKNELDATHDALYENAKIKSVGSQLNEALIDARRFAGFTPAGLASAGIGVGVEKAVEQVLPEAPKEVGVGLGGAVTTKLMMGGGVAGGLGSVGSYEVGRVAGAGARHIAKEFGASEEVQKHADIIASGSAGLASFPTMLGIGESLVSAGIGIEASPIPFPPFKILGGLAILGGGLAEGINYLAGGSPSQQQEQPSQQSSNNEE